MENKKNTNQANMEQRARIKKHLIAGKPITQSEATKLYDCANLSWQIYKLRSEGMNIEMKLITDENGKRCAQYYLVIRTKRRQKPVHQTEQVRQGTIDFTEPETVQEHEPIEETVTINVPVVEPEHEQTQQPEQPKPVETDGKKRRVNRSIYGEIRCDYLNPEGYWTVDAWTSKFEDDMEEEGRVIAAIDSETAKVFYVDGCAKSDPYAQDVIDNKIREIRMEQEERQVQAMLDAVAV